MSTKKLQIVGGLGNKVYVQNDEPTDAADGSLWLDMDEEEINGMDVMIPPATAKVGQTIIVRSVDENGKPIEWEAVDNLRYVASNTEPEDKNAVWIDTSDFDGDFNQVLVDSTLTQIGHAADAKTTGDAINQLTSVCDGLKKIYISDVAPSDTTDGTIWVDTSEL